MKKRYIFLIIILCFCVYKAGVYHYKHTFSTEKWIKSEEKNLMVDDMLEKHELMGMEKDQVYELLGFDTPNAYFKEDDNWVYWLGMERGLISIDSEWLVITFEDEKVADYYITTD